MIAPKLNAMIPNLNMPVTRRFVADYEVSAFVPSIGISYSFDL